MLRRIFHVLSRFPLHFMLYRGIWIWTVYPYSKLLKFVWELDQTGKKKQVLAVVDGCVTIFALIVLYNSQKKFSFRQGIIRKNDNVQAALFVCR